MLSIRNPGVQAGIASALLFGAGTPVAKALLGEVSPWLLAGLLYAGSGLGLGLYRLIRRAPRVRLRRGEDYTILDTVASGMSYSPEKLSMERVGDAAFGPVDRIGQLTMRNLDIADSRFRLEHYAAAGFIGGATGELVGELEKGGAQEITEHAVDYDADREELAEAVDEANEAASFDFGAD